MHCELSSHCPQIGTSCEQPESPGLMATPTPTAATEEERRVSPRPARGSPHPPDTQHDQLPSQEQSSIMNKDVQLDREFLHTHLAHPAAHSPPPSTRPLHLRVLRPGTQACRGHYIGTQDCPSLALPSKEHPSPLARGCLTSLCQTLGGSMNKACCNFSHQDW